MSWLVSAIEEHGREFDGRFILTWRTSTRSVQTIDCIDGQTLSMEIWDDTEKTEIRTYNTEDERDEILQSIKANLEIQADPILGQIS